MSLPDKVELAIRQIERDFYIDDDYLIKASEYFLQTKQIQNTSRVDEV